MMLYKIMEKQKFYILSVSPYVVLSCIFPVFVFCRASTRRENKEEENCI